MKFLSLLLILLFSSGVLAEGTEEKVEEQTKLPAGPENFIFPVHRCIKNEVDCHTIGAHPAIKKHMGKFAKIREEVKALEKTYHEKPGFEHKKGNELFKEMRIASVELQTAKEFELFEAICTDAKDEEAKIFCVGPERAAVIKGHQQGRICLSQRWHQLYTSEQKGNQGLKDTLNYDEHMRVWNTQETKSCDKLLESDRAAIASAGKKIEGLPVVPPVVPPATEAVDATAEAPSVDPAEAKKKAQKKLRSDIQRCAKPKPFGSCSFEGEQATFVGDLKSVYATAGADRISLSANGNPPLTDPAFIQALSKEDEDSTEGEIALYKKYCEASKDPASVFCLSAEDEKEMRAEKEKLICRHKRLHQMGLSPKGKDDSEPGKLWDRHNDEWPKLKPGENCDTLLAADKKIYGVVEEKVEAPVAAVATPVAPVAVVAAVAPAEEKPEENEDEKSPKNYLSKTCEWVKDLPRRLVNGPGEKGCKKESSAMFCTGYVVCDRKEGGGKFVRMSTCGPEFCGPTKKDAISCTKQKTHFSYPPKDEDKQFVSPKVKSGAVKQ